MKKIPIKKHLILTGIIWTLGILLISLTDIYHISNYTTSILRNEALSNFNKDAATRYWTSMHGGVYVPETEETKPNPFLSHIPERDILTPSGKKLTLMNPAYMLRQTMDNFYKLYGIKGHITSLSYFRPETAPDAWEIKALKAFETGADEISEFSTFDGTQFYRLMRPLHVKESCLKCHGDQGYNLGDIRGGISISIPTLQYITKSNREYLLHGIRNAFVWLMGLFLLFLTGKKIIAKENERSFITKQLKEQKALLETNVLERTRELTESYERLKDEIEKKEKLKIVLEKSDKIINNSKAVAFIWKNKPNWPVEFVSNNVNNLLGYSATDFISGNIVYSEIIHKEDLNRIEDELKLNGGNLSIKGFTHKNYRIITKSGKIVWVEDRTTIIRNDQNEIIQYEGFILDISERKKIENENRFKTEFERKIATISTYFVNLKLKDVNKALSFTSESFGRFLEINRSYVILLNSKNELEIKSEFLKGNTTSLKAKHKIFSTKTYSWLLVSLLKGKPLLIENTNQLGSVAKNEKELMTSLDIKSFLAVPIVINNMLHGFIGFDSKDKFGILSKKHFSLYSLLTEVVTNLYSRYLNEVELIKITDTNRSLIQAVEQSADSVVITDFRGKIEYVNPKFVERTGYTLEEVLGENPRILKSGHTPSNEYENLWKTISFGKSWKGQFKNVDKKNNIFWEQATISPIKNEQGIITHFLAIKEDITDKLLLENQRSLSQKMESIGQLAAGIAHEINTPMQYVGDNANFLADSYSSMTTVFSDFNSFLEDGNNYSNDEIRDFYQNKKEEMDLEFIFEEVPEALEQTKTGIAHVTKIVRAMKDFAHPGSKEKTYFNLNNGLKNTVTISKNEWKYVAEVGLNLDENLTEILCLQDELNQVFLNMIVNSAHAIDEKNKENNLNELGKITIETKKNNEIVHVRISDTGNGIKKEIIDRIFDPFFTTKEVGKGTGQGLAIVHDIIVNKHHGKIFVESDEGIGTKFFIELPIDGKKVEK